MRRLVATLAAAVALAVVAAEPAAAAAPPSRLPAFSSCTELVSFARRNLNRPAVPPRVGPGAIATLGARAPMPEPAAVPESDAAQPVAAAGALAQASVPVAGEDFSPTNVQEAGIDEPDLAKTDGRRLFVVAAGQLRAYDVTGDAPALLGTLSLEGAGGELLLRGDRLLLIGPAPTARAAQDPPRPAVAPAPAPPPQVTAIAPAAPATTRLVEIDVRDPSAMRIARSMSIPGQHVSARLRDGTARVVITSPAALPGAGDDDRDPPVATTAARRPGVSAFVPRTVLRSRITKRTFRRPLAACREVRHPRAYAGNDLLTVLTIDLDRGLFNVDRDAILAGAQVVYASPTGLYVASQRAVTVRPGAVPDGMRTELHRFDISRPNETAYASSGSVPGFVLNQYTVSEHDGALRVATTEEPLWAARNPEDRVSQSAVTVLRQRGTALEQVGRVGGLGRGERIYAVRFIADAGYLVTFRQIDPLYTLDLREPERPRVVGELKIPGYSAYLHPIGDGLLLGVGRAEGLEEVGRIVHGPAWDRSEVVRSVIVRDRVLTISEQGVAAHRLDGLAPVGFAPLAG